MTYEILKNKTNRLMNDRSYEGKRYFDLFMMLLVIVSVILLLFEIETGQKVPWTNPFVVDDVILIIFIVEYLSRLWVCSSIRKDFKKALRSPNRNSLLKVLTGLYIVARNKAKYMIQPMSIIDLLAILPMFRVFRAFRIFRLLRIFKLIRYSHSIESLFSVLRTHVFEMGIVLGFIILVVIVSSTFIYVIEKGVPRGNFQSLSDAMWWSFVTITTVGYGDKVPVTDAGRIIAVLLMLCAVVSIALPSGILASAITQKFISIKEERLNMQNFKNHIVICGWNNSAEQFMKVLEKHPDGQKRDIVAVTLKPLEEIDAKNVIVKHGDFAKEGILKDVNIKNASYVIVVAEELRGISDESIDARSFLACNLIHNHNPDIYMIVQLLNTENANILRKTINNIEIIVSDNITGGLLSNSIINPGTSKLVNTLIAYNQDNIMKVPANKLNGEFKTFRDLWSFCRNPSYNWLPLAVERDGEVFINPKDDFELTERDNMFYIQTEMDV
ncbi:MAG: ion transporter [Candidatus Scalinduaceae bacterium]